MPETIKTIYGTPSPVARLGGSSGNHKTFNAENGEGLTFAVGSPKLPENFMIVSGSTREGESVRYVFSDGVFFTIDSKKVQAVGRDNKEPVRTGIGEAYGEIDEITDVSLIEPPKESEDALYTTLLERRNAIASSLDKRDRKLGDHSFSGVLRRSGYETSAGVQETFDAEEAVSLKFLESTVHLVELDNFISPSGTFKRSATPPQELLAYRDRQVRIATSAGETINYATQRHTAERNKREDARGRMRADISDFIFSDTRGANICRTMGIEPKDVFSLSPKQSVELVGHIMYETTNYDHAATKGKTNRADSLDALSILEHGMNNYHRKEDIPPLGVCRNFASLGRELFLALKEKNDILRNTFCYSNAGYGGASSGALSSGAHAWLDFVMVTDKDTLVAMTADPTWVKKAADGSLANYSQTDRRIGTHVRTITESDPFNYSANKAHNAKEIQNQYIHTIKKSISTLAKRYNPKGEHLSLKRVPDEDNHLRRAVFGSIEMQVFAKTVAGGERMEIPEQVKQIASRAADMPEEYTSLLTVSEHTIIIENLLDSIYDAQNSTDKRMVARKRLDAMVGLCLKKASDHVSVVHDGDNTVSLREESKKKLSAVYGGITAQHIVLSLTRDKTSK